MIVVEDLTHIWKDTYSYSEGNHTFITSEKLTKEEIIAEMEATNTSAQQWAVVMFPKMTDDEVNNVHDMARAQNRIKGVFQKFDNVADVNIRRGIINNIIPGSVKGGVEKLARRYRTEIRKLKSKDYERYRKWGEYSHTNI